MATGWAGDGAVRDQIDATVDDAIARARRQLREDPVWNTVRNATRRFRWRGARPCLVCGCALRASRRGMTKSRRMPGTTGVAARTAS